MSECYADQDPKFQPAMRLIASITNSYPAIITTTFDHDYVTGTIARFYLPACVGMMQLDKRKGIITVTSTDAFTIDIDTTYFDPFSIPAPASWHDNTCALVVPIGEIASKLTASVRDTG